MQEKINEHNIVFIADENQCFYSLVNIRLVMDGYKSSKPINFYLILNKISSKDITKIHLISKELNIHSNLNLVILDEVNLLTSNLKHVTNTANAKLFLHDTLNNLDRILYLDNDTVVTGCISEAFNHLEKYKNYARRWNPKSLWPRRLRWRKLIEDDYFNSGVMLLSLEQLRQNWNYVDDLELLESLKFVDQDLLNIMLNFQKMDWKLNICRNKWPKDKQQDLPTLKIFHFLSEDKQWSNKKPSFYTKGRLSKKEKKSMEKPKALWEMTYNKIKDIINCD